MNPRRSSRIESAEALAIELDMAGNGHISDDPRVQIAARLRPATIVRESTREHTKDRMLRAFQAAAGAAATEDAGTRDSITAESNVARLELPDGSQVLAADIETITPEKSAQVAASLAQLAAERRGQR